MAQSAPHLAIARNYDDLDAPQSRPVPRAVGGSLPPRQPPARSLMATVVEADASSTPEEKLGAVWQDLMDGRLVVREQGRTSTRRYVIARRVPEVAGRSRALGRIETAVLVRVLCGDQQKLVASDLGIACSTASKWYTTAIDKLQLRSGPIPLPLILAAQSWANDRTLDVDARSTCFEYEGTDFFLLSTAAPVGRADRMTLAEYEVAKLVIDGVSRWDIAKYRATSAQTVACQLRGVYSKCRVTGRYALIRHVEAGGWFR
jgi:DNA-binding NarL/FixJ family response regulator